MLAKRLEEKWVSPSGPDILIREWFENIFNGVMLNA
jgi:hypothetical protein